MKNSQSSLITYIKCVWSGRSDVVSRQSSQDYSVAIFIAVQLLWFLSSLGGGGLPLFLPLAALFACCLAYLSIMIQKKPSLHWLIPITWKRKSVYFLIAALFMTAVASVTFMAVAGIIILIVALFVLLVSGEWIFVAEASEEAELFICAQGNGFAAAMAFAGFGLVLLFAFIKRRWLRNLLLLLTPLIICIPCWIYSAAAKLESGNFFLDFDAVPYSWVFLMLACVAAAALVVAGTVRFILYMRAKEY